jgi:serine/threonine protein kinase
MNAPGWAAPAGAGARRQAGLGQRQKYVINEGLAMEPGGMSAQQQKEWLGRSARWPDLQANHYVGKRVLGSGTHAIVGVWERQGIPPAAMPKLIVVKQVSDMGPGVLSIPLRVESKVMRDILGTNTEHVVKLYKSFYREGGSGSHTQRDPLPFGNNGAWATARFVARFYMEYCRNGNLKSQLDKVIEQGEVIPEEYIWRFLHCLASALVVIRHGNEDHLNNRPTWNIPIAHFDIKPGNSKFSLRQGICDDSRGR